MQHVFFYQKKNQKLIWFFVNFFGVLEFRGPRCATIAAKTTAAAGSVAQHKKRAAAESNS